MTNHPFSPEGRIEALQAMSDETFDLLIIGGGITGSGIARDATLRGLKVALVEKEDFAYGTSSRSSKLVHGGVRYLATGNVGLVKESARERKVLKKIAPHLIHPLDFIIPVFKSGSLIKYRTGFLLFDKLAKSTKDETHRTLTADEVREYAPLLREPLKSGIVYGEYITEDARFTVMNARSAAEHGARVVNHTAVTSFRYDDAGTVIGATVKDQLTSNEHQITAALTINATGPWAEDLLQKNDLQAPETLLLSKGIHLVFPAEKIPLTSAVLLESSDGKSGFIIRRWNYVYVGTTDVIHEGDIDQPGGDQAAIDYLFDLAVDCFPEAKLEKEDILGIWAGLRPLIKQEGKSTRDTSRDDEVWKIKEGLLTVAGGKLTTYRKMSERVLKEVAKDLPKKFGDNQKTEEVVLPGGDIGEDYYQYQRDMSAKLKAAGIPPVAIERLVWLYGAANDELLAYGEDDIKWIDLLAKNVPGIKGEVKLAVEKEMALTITDFMDRRSALLIFDKNHGMDAVNEVADIMADLLNWDDAERTRQIEEHYKNAEKVLI
ncbi:glycerol-3-phosphate dehydrogenase/oxidase [Sporosarcina sp.]|uniref:glycerol-3-phosphate dehydrogenase/oxidase n=1 Tax=Sporosarcina sp. TaxID=49982 RepID=UPI002636A9CC|nr:glycerol-3-phosphate dehydrogenase/oxidase [Sporosarcina sp.]